MVNINNSNTQTIIIIPFIYLNYILQIIFNSYMRIIEPWYSKTSIKITNKTDLIFAIMYHNGKG